MVTKRKGRDRLRLINLGAVGPEEASTGPQEEIIDLSLGYRVMISEQAEVWTLGGVLRNGTFAREDVGELSFAVIPGEEGPATAITGFIAPSAPYTLAMEEKEIREALGALLTQLGYDQEGYYLSVGIGGRYLFHEAPNRV